MRLGEGHINSSYWTVFGVYQILACIAPMYINWNELKAFLFGMASIMGTPPPNNKQISLMFKALDKNRDGKISFNEIKGVLSELVEILKND